MPGWGIILIIAAALLLALLAYRAYKLFRQGLFRGGGTIKAITDQNDIFAPYAAQIEQGKAWFLSQPLEQVELTSEDGVTLRGYYLPAERPRAAVLLVHGFRSSGPHDFSCALRFMHEQGITILLPDQRASGRSDGECVTFGCRERYDCMRWLEYLCGRVGDMPVFLDGISMGATTVLLMTALGLPENVRGVIADCGFTTPWDEAKHVLRHMVRFPVYPTIWVAGLLARRLCGFSLRGFDTAEAMRACRVPVLFLHGEADSFVPAEMTKRNFAACAAEKELILVPGAGHAMSFLVDRPRCEEALERFLDKYTGS